MAKYVFGIDLGTTYSCIAYVDETGRATVINNQEGTNTTPSVVNFASPTQVVVGQVAKENAVIDPQNTVSLVKTLMGKSNFAISYNGEDVSPEEASSYILRKLAGDASKLIDAEVKDVVITCPAYFGTAERTATKNAGEIAGLNVIEIISEPTAAALYYGCAKEQGEKTVLVYDLGGGTFDVTVMHVSPGKIEMVCSDGNHELGGKNWDDAVMQYLASEFCSETGFDGDFDEYAQQDLRLKAEKAKQQLSTREKVPVMMDAAGLRARVEITRQTFDEITEALLNESIEKTDAAIALAAERGYTIDEILLVGGSTRMPQVTKILTEKYGMEPKILEPDEAVAKGAAIYALGAYEVKVEQWKEMIESGQADMTDTKTREEAEKYSEPAAVTTNEIPGLRGHRMDEVVTVVTSKSYALQVVRNGEDKCCNMIIKDVLMPGGSLSVTRQFGTVDANQETAELVVFENDFHDEYFDVDTDFILGNATLDLPGNLPAGAPIEVTFTLNKEGILEVTGRDLTTNREIHATMQATAGTIMSKEEVAAAKAKSKGIAVE
ncbi:MAG: Hsp70 family protein [Acutalibacter sp.]|nr:Hsp70 family protein [Candidatus Acutalibacter stercoravium]